MYTWLPVPQNVARAFTLLLIASLVIIAVASTGCGKHGNELAPLSGKVTYQGRPLSFGSVMLLPQSGAPATGIIQPDGTFSMKTRGFGDGAAVGKNRVRIVCFESQNPISPMFGSEALGKPLIPQKYSSWETSGIEIAVRSNENEPVLLELID